MEEYLKTIHADDYHGTDDDMPDAFEDWMANDLMIEELIEYADKYAKSEWERGFDMGNGSKIQDQIEILSKIEYTAGRMEGLTEAKEILKKVYIPEGAEADYEDYSGATEGDR